MDELLKDEIKTVNINGKDYEISPVNIGILSAIETSFEGGIKGMLAELSEKSYTATLKLARIFTKVPDPELIKSQRDVMNLYNAIQEALTDFFKGE